MRRKYRNAHTDQDRCAGRCHDAVIRSRRNTHSENDAAEHGENERDDQPVSRDIDDRVDQFICETGHRDRTGDNARNTAGCADCDRAASAGLKRFEDLERRNTVLAVHKTDSNREQDREGSRALHGHHISGYPDNQHDQREQQIDLADQNAEFRELFLRDALKTESLRLKMYGNENTRKVQDRRQDRAHDNIRIRHADKVCHKERCSTHDRGHDLSAG